MGVGVVLGVLVVVVVVGCILFVLVVIVFVLVVIGGECVEYSTILQYVEFFVVEYVEFVGLVFVQYVDVEFVVELDGAVYIEVLVGVVISTELVVLVLLLRYYEFVGVVLEYVEIVMFEFLQLDLAVIMDDGFLLSRRQKNFGFYKSNLLILIINYIITIYENEIFSKSIFSIDGKVIQFLCSTLNFKLIVLKLTNKI